MNTMSVNVATVRSATSVARARESARDFSQVSYVRSQPRMPTPCSWSSRSPSPTPCVTAAAPAQDLTAHPDSIEVTVHDHSPQAPRMRTPDLNDGTGGFGWPMVNRLARTTAVTRQADGGKTVSALLAR